MIRILIAFLSVCILYDDIYVLSSFLHPGKFQDILDGAPIMALYFCHVQFSSVAQSCLTLCDPMNRSTPGLPVHHWLPEFIQTHVHQFGDAIQPSHPLSSPSPPAHNPSQHQGLYQWVNSLHEVAKVLDFQLQHHPSNEHPRLISFMISLQSKGLSRVFSNTTVQKHQFFSAQFSSQSISHIHTWPLEKP